MIQICEAIFCEAMYCYYRNNELAHRRRPLPRGAEFIVKMKHYLDFMNEAAERPQIKIVTDYRSRNAEWIEKTRI